MEFSAELGMAILSIVMIDLVLAGDNAVVIALASRNLPVEQRKQAIYIGTFGAIVIRVVMTAAAVWLMKIPYLQAIGGLVLIPVAIKLLAKEDHGEDGIKAGNTMFQAIKTIIIADAVMGVDNVLAIAGASHGNMLLVVFGLLISVPIVVWGSKYLSELMTRHPSLVYVGSGILAWTAGSMLMGDKIVGLYLKTTWAPLGWIIPAAILVITLAIGKLREPAAKVQRDAS